MGAGLGGGSSDARRRPVTSALAGKRLPLATLTALAADLAATSRSSFSEALPLASAVGHRTLPALDASAAHGILLARYPRQHRASYRDLSPRLTPESQRDKLAAFQSVTWDSGSPTHNDFEEVVFEQHPALGEAQKETAARRSHHAMMTGSGSCPLWPLPDRRRATQAIANSPAKLSHLPGERPAIGPCGPGMAV